MKDALKGIFRDPPILYSNRLVLRKMEKSDAEDMFLYARDEEVTKYLLWSPHPSVNHTAKYLSTLAAHYRSGEFYDWAITLKGRMIGNCGFSKLDLKNRCGEIGYVLARDVWGMGIAAEAAEKLLEFGFERLRLHRIEVHYMIENEASRRVAEKIGMTFEGVLRDSLYVKGIHRSIGICSILYDEYINRKYK